MPIPQRKFTATNLIPGKTYRVIAVLKDYDGVIHSDDEICKFLEKNFLPYDDGLSIFVEKDGQKIQFRLQWHEESQAAVIDNFSLDSPPGQADFVEEV